MSTVLTLLAVYFLYLVVPPLVKWAFIDADWTGTSRQDCTGGGACWVFITVRFNQFIYGFYPAGQQWRVNLAVILLAVMLVTLYFKRVSLKFQVVTVIALTYSLIVYILLVGGVLGLVPVDTSLWGGLMLTLIIAGTGIAVSLPIGILLALGRRSEMPVVRALCVAFIEIWRGVPLITVLFMGSVMLPLFLPEGMNFNKLLRALIGIVLFQSAYMAEVVRGGLQGIPRGQYEAADALGLGYWKSMRLIVLPQALKLVIPGIVNTFIALLKDTSLVLIIGLLDLLAIVQAAFTDPDWLGYAVEGYVFAGFVFWLFCFSISQYSRYLERRLSVGR